MPDLEATAKAAPAALPLLDIGVAALYEPLRLLKADLCLNPARFQSWERLASALHCINEDQKQTVNQELYTQQMLLL